MFCSRFFLRAFFLCCLIFSVSAQNNLDDANSNNETVSDDTEKSYVITDDTEETPDNSEPINTSSPSLVVFSIWDGVRMIFVLGIVLLMIYGLFFLLKRLGNNAVPDNELIKIIDVKNISSGKAFYVIQLYELFFLVGVSDSSISLISEITNKEVKDRLELLSSTSVAGKKSFSDVLRGLIGRGSDIKHSKEKMSVDFLKEQKERLKKL